MRSILYSKLHPPRLAPGLLDRQRLFERLDQGLAAHFTLVAAPAGYGKTTLLAQWARRQDMTTVWLWLEEGDDGPGPFLHALVSAIRAVIPDGCHNIHTLLDRPELPPMELLAHVLRSDLENVEDFILIIDDFHTVKDPTVLEIVHNLVYQPPGPLHLVVSCRADPLLALGAMRGRGILNEIRAEHLRFNEEEAAEYLGRIFGRPLGNVYVSFLVERTEGWIAGLHLAALSLRGRDDLVEGIREFAGSDRYIADYLMEELLARLPQAVVRYLVATSILERLSAPLCSAVMAEGNVETIDGKPILEWLEQSNLFVFSLDEQRQWFRYHHLFRELLHHRLLVGSPASEVETLHVRAGEWLAAAREVDYALEHLAQGGRPDLVADVVEQQCRSAIDGERWRALARWLARVDPGIARERPRLVLAHAWLAHEHANRPETSFYCDRAEELLDLQPRRDDGEILRGEISALRAEMAYWQGDNSASLFHARQALPRLSRASRYPWALAIIFEGGSLQALGELPAAMEVFHRASLEAYGEHADPRVTVGLALIGFVAAQLDQPRQAAEQMLSQVAGSELEDSIRWANFLIGLAAYLRNDLDVAEAHFQLVEPYTSNVVPAKQSAYGLAWIRHSQGRVDDALRILDQFEPVASALDARLSTECRLLRARLAALSGRPTSEVSFARSFVTAAGDGVSGLNVCFEFSPLSALALLVAAGSADDMPACEKAVQRLLARSETTHNVFRSIQCLILQALVLGRQRRTAEALASLGEAVSLAAPGRVVRLFPEMGEPVHVLLRALQARGHSDPFLDELMVAFAPGAAVPGVAPTSRSALPLAQHMNDVMLTNRELDVLELLAQRMSNKEIARQLVISPATVKRHALSIYSKLAVGGRREAVVRARETGLLLFPPG